MNNIVIFTGAGISAESGIKTFRDSGGLWEEYKIEDVATPEAFATNPELVLKFYNIRRKQLINSAPNIAHYALSKLEKFFNVSIITQNVDNLHERSGSKKVLHLHGELMEAKSIIDGTIYPLKGSELNIGDKCNQGSQLRPNIVWFGEDVPNMNVAINIVKQANIFIVIGTSLNVYPAASLINYAINSKRIIIIDPNANHQNEFEVIKEKATVAVPKLINDLISNEK